jgi:hypothetical protein
VAMSVRQNLPPSAQIQFADAARSVPVRSAKDSREEQARRPDPDLRRQEGLIPASRLDHSVRELGWKSNVDPMHNRYFQSSPGLNNLAKSFVPRFALRDSAIAKNRNYYWQNKEATQVPTFCT